jgi:putative ABC transport system ATP-binding protein
MLQVRDLRTSILEPASFSLSAGEALAVRGPSGAGKTLLLRAVADLDPNEGLVTLDGRDRSTIAGPQWRRLVGYVPAEPGWWADTVGEHFGEWNAALALVSDLGFPNEAKAWPITRLSTGERLRVALARALMMRPKVLLLDEPTAALDVAAAALEDTQTLAAAGYGVAWLRQLPLMHTAEVRRGDATPVPGSNGWLTAITGFSRPCGMRRSAMSCIRSTLP